MGSEHSNSPIQIQMNLLKMVTAKLCIDCNKHRAAWVSDKYTHQSQSNSHVKTPLTRSLLLCMDTRGAPTSWFTNSECFAPMKLSIRTLKVCGLKRRSVYQEFSKYDLFFVTETKLNHTNVISDDGYCFESQSRQASYIPESGSMGCL